MNPGTLERSNRESSNVGKDHLLSVKESSIYLNLAKITVYKFVSSRQIPFIKVGRRVLFRKQDLDKWLEQKSVKPIEKKR